MWVRRRKTLRPRSKVFNLYNFRKAVPVLKLRGTFNSKPQQFLKTQLVSDNHYASKKNLRRSLAKRSHLKNKDTKRYKRNYLKLSYTSTRKFLGRNFPIRTYSGAKKQAMHWGASGRTIILGRPYYSSKLFRTKNSIKLLKKDYRKWFLRDVFTRKEYKDATYLRVLHCTRTVKLLLNSLFIPDLILPYTFYSSPSHFFSYHFQLTKDCVSVLNSSPSPWLVNQVTPTLTLNLTTLFNGGNRSTSIRLLEDTSVRNLDAMHGIPNPDWQELLWTSLSFNFITSWSRTKFSYFFKRSKLYLAIYLVASRYFLVHSTYYTSDLDQGSFKSSVFSLTSWSKLNGSYFTQNAKTIFFSVRGYSPNFVVNRGQTYIRHRRSFFKTALNNNKLTKQLNGIKLTTSFNSKSLHFSLRNKGTNRIGYTSRAGSRLKLYRKLRTHSRFYYKQSLKLFLKVYYMLYKKYIIVLLLKKKLRKQRKRLLRLTSRFTKLDKTEWWVKSRVWVNTLLSNVNSIYVPALLSNNILGLKIPRYFNTRMRHSYLAPVSTNNSSYSTTQFYVYKNQLGYHPSLTKPGRIYTPSISYIINLNKFSKQNNYFFFLKSILLLKHAYYVSTYPSFRTMVRTIFGAHYKPLLFTNLLPDTSFNLSSRKFLNSARAHVFFQENVVA